VLRGPVLCKIEQRSFLVVELTTAHNVAQQRQRVTVEHADARLEPLPADVEVALLMRMRSSR